MKKYVIAPLFIVALMQFCNAQSPGKSRSNALSLELGKSGLIFNLSYDHKFNSKNLGLRAGAGSNFANNLNAKSFGGGVYYLWGKANRYFETGIDMQYLIVNERSDDQKGVSLVYPDYAVKTTFPSLNMGYRCYGKNTLFRAGFSPGMIVGKFVPGGYISYGFTF
jgi:hypothetical protein